MDLLGRSVTCSQVKQDKESNPALYSAIDFFKDFVTTFMRRDKRIANF